MTMATYILYSKTLMLEITTKIFTYIVYIILLILISLFFAHLSIMTTEPIYIPELCLEIVLLILFLDSWWSKTPTVIRIMMIGADTIAIEEFLRSLALRHEWIPSMVYHVAIILVLSVHLIIKLIETVKEVQKCISEFYEEDSKDVPLSSVMISQIPLA